MTDGNGQDLERRRKEAALRAAQGLLSGGVESQALSTLVSQLESELQVQPPMTAEQMAFQTLPGQAQLAVTGFRAAVGAGQVVARTVDEMLRLLGNIPLRPGEVPPGAPKRRLEDMINFEETKQIIDERLGVPGAAQIASDVGAELIGMTVTGYAGAALVPKVLGVASFSPRALHLDRITGLISGAVAGAVSEPGRTVRPSDEEGWKWLDPAGSIARELMARGLVEDEGAALAIGGAALGGALGGLFDAFGARRALKMRRQGEAMEAAFQTRLGRVRLEEAGIIVPGEKVTREAVGRYMEKLAWQLTEQPPKVVIPDDVAKLAAEHMSAERVALAGFEQIPNPSDVAAGTKVADVSGRPLRVYHGTMAEKEFPFPSPRETPTGGVYFSENPEVANLMAGGVVSAELGERLSAAGVSAVRPPEAAGRVFPAYLRVRNPLNLDSPPSNFVDTWLKMHPGPVEGGRRGLAREKELIDFAKEQGYDAFTFMDVFGPKEMPVARTWVVFNDEQIVSAMGVNVDDALVVRSMLQGNPEGINVMRGMDVEEARRAVQQLEMEGAQLDVLSFPRGDGTADLLIASREIVTGDLPQTVRVLNQRALESPEVVVFNRRLVEDALTESTEASVFITPNGDVVGGEFGSHAEIAAAVTRHLGIDTEYPVQYVSTRLGWIRVSHHPDGLLIDVSSRLTMQQRTTLASLPGFRGRFYQRAIIDQFERKFPEPVSRIGGAELEGLGGRPGAVLRALDDLNAPPLEGQRVVSPLQGDAGKRLRAQFKNEGVFEGQAAVISRNGTPVEIIKFDPKTREYTIRGPLSGDIKGVAEDAVKPLNTTFAGFREIDRAVLESLSPDEAKAFTKLRRLAERRAALAGPITTIRELEEVAAATAGIWVRPIAGGEVQLIDLISGDVLRFESFQGAKTWLMNYQPVIPDLTPQAFRDLNFGMGWIGGGGPPLLAGDQIPLPQFRHNFDPSKRLGAGLSRHWRPSRNFFLSLERATGVAVWTRGFGPVQRDAVRANNFRHSWAVSGTGFGMPRGVHSLEEIFKMAGGRKANAELITDWLEMSHKPAKLAAIEARMTPGEIGAAKELRKWYDALFDRLGLDPTTWLTDFAPHYRAMSPDYGNSAATIWRQTRSRMGMLPKEIRFMSRMRRFGTLKVYEKDAFEAAHQYLRGGANELYLHDSWRRARALINSVKDRSITQPLQYYLEAIRGVEFVETVDSIRNTFTRMMRQLPGMEKWSLKEIKGAADDLGFSLIGLSYQATMGFRPGLAVRNMTQTLQTTWTLFGTHPRNFLKAIRLAATREGRDMAAAVGAITKRQIPLYGGEAWLERMPSGLNRLSEISLKMYTGADELNRAIAYHLGRLEAEDAIRSFAQRASRARSTAEISRFRAKLLRDANMIVYDRPVIDEFLRRLTTSGKDAAEFAGKQAADVTQFLYGRGNQPRWLRTVQGRFVGQFGTWPIWYYGFVGRTSTNLYRNGGITDVLRFWGRLAIANAAIIYAGHEVLDIDLSRWSAYRSFFFTGGPGAEVVTGLMSGIKGLGALATMSDVEQEFGKRRLKAGVETLYRTGRAFIPEFYAVRDAARALDAVSRGEYLEAAAGVLGTRPTDEYLANRQLDALEIFEMGEPGEDDTSPVTELERLGISVRRQKEAK